MRYEVRIGVESGSSVAEVGKLTLEFKQLKNEAKDAGGATDKAASGVSKFAGAAGLLGGALASLQIGAVVADAKAFAEQIADLRIKTGETAEELSTLAQAAGQNGTSFDKLEKVIFKLSETAAKQGKTAVQLFSEYRDELAGMADGAEKSARAQELFGKAANDILPFFAQGSKSIQEYREQAELFGTLVSGELATASDAFGDNVSQISDRATGLANVFLTDLLPSFNTLYETMTDGETRSQILDNSVLLLSGSLKTAALAVIVLKNAFDQLLDIGDAAIEAIAGPDAIEKLAAYGRVIPEILFRSIEGEQTQNQIFKTVEDQLNSTLERINKESIPSDSLVDRSKANLTDITSSFEALFADIVTEGNASNKSLIGNSDALAERVKVNSEKQAQAAERAAKREADARKRVEDARDREEQQVQAAIDRRNLEIERSIQAQVQAREDLIKSAERELELAAAATNQERTLLREKFRVEDAVERIADMMARTNELAGQSTDLTAEQKAKLEGVAAELDNINEKARQYNEERARSAAEASSAFGVTQGEDGRFESIDSFIDLFAKGVEEGFDAADLGEFFARLNDGLKVAYENFGGGLAGVVGVAGTILNEVSGIIDVGRNSNGNRNGDMARAISDRLAQSGNPYAIAASALDRFAGGNLFGTQFSVRNQGYNVAFGADGASGNQFVNETRRRSLFRGSQNRTTTSALDDGLQNQIDQSFDRIEGFLARASIRLGVNVVDVLDSTFRQTVDAQGRVTEQYGIVAGRRINANLNAITQALFGESLVDQISQSALSAQSIADRWRGGTEQAALALAEGAQFLFEAQADIVEGNALLNGENALTRTADLIERMDTPFETLSETYERLEARSNLLVEASEAMRLELDEGSEAFVEFANAIVEEAGSLQEANDLFSRFINGFFSEQERAQLGIDRTTQRRNALAQQLNLDANIDSSALRGLITDAIQSGIDPDKLVLLLEFADAILDVNDAQGVYNETIGDTNDKLAEANQAYKDFMRGIRDDLEVEAERRGLSEYNAAIAAIGRETQGQIDAANELARAAGEAGASTEDLTDVLARGSIRMADAAAALERKLSGVAQRLFNIAPPATTQQQAYNYDLGGYNPIRQQEDPARFAEFSAFAADVRSLADARGDDAFAVLERLQAPLLDLLAGLNVDTRDVSGDFDDFVAAARQLGLELPDLAARLNQDLGQLGDDLSALNNGFEDAIGKLNLREDDRTQLLALLQSLEDGTGSQADIERFVNTLTAAQRSALAPFLPGVDVTSFEEDSLDSLSNIDKTIKDGNFLLGQILGVLGGRDIAKGGVADNEKRTSAETAQLVLLRDELRNGVQTISQSVNSNGAETARALRLLADRPL